MCVMREREREREREGGERDREREREGGRYQEPNSPSYNRPFGSLTVVNIIFMSKAYQARFPLYTS